MQLENVEKVEQREICYSLVRPAEAGVSTAGHKSSAVIGGT